MAADQIPSIYDFQEMPMVRETEYFPLVNWHLDFKEARYLHTLLTTDSAKLEEAARKVKIIATCYKKSEITTEWRVSFQHQPSLAPPIDAGRFFTSVFEYTTWHGLEPLYSYGQTLRRLCEILGQHGADISEALHLLE